MKQLTIVVRPFKAEAVLKAITELDVIACSVQEAKGYSRQKGSAVSEWHQFHIQDP